ncbi:hypothetical protein KM043_000216 [Ampulex compressa]|nr:hypothetical protein KM043_000216 [Ampulex compressa]
MRLVSLERLREIQGTPDPIRNICILAHVDHGKTTLADSLVASNGIISNKLAGKLRYLDSRPDEQLRGITMKSSSITLYHCRDQKEYVVNLIDSPGHVDFASEVSTAVRICDGAIIVVDVVEGVCPQTRSALTISYTEGLKPILVLNKMDRLITEMKLSPLDAYVHLTQVLEQVNAVMGEIFASDIMEREDKERFGDDQAENTGESNSADGRSTLLEMDDSSLYFSPEDGNVLFSSATDGWGFGIKEFAKIFSEKLGFSEKILSKTLWGDFYVNGKTKRIVRGAQEKAKKPLFVQLILDNVWTLYETIIARKDKERIPVMAEKLDIKLTARDLRHSDPKGQLRAVFSQWLPLAKACLDAVCEQVPAPCDLPSEKVERLMRGNLDFRSLPAETRQLREALLACDSSASAPIVVFVSKMYAVDKRTLPENRPKPLTASELARRKELARQKHAERMDRESSVEGRSPAEFALEAPEAEPYATEGVEGDGEAEHEAEAEAESESEQQQQSALIAFARVYSGSLRVGREVYVLGPKHRPESGAGLEDSRPGKYVTRFVPRKLYLQMGKELVPVEAVAAGNICGIGGLEEHVLKTGTLSSTLACPSFSELTSLAVPILRVALEPKRPNDLPKLIEGLKLLNQADASAVVCIQETGEIVLNTAGEVHLERCLEDLRTSYAKVEVNVSEPIVPFRETVVPRPKIDMASEAIERRGEEARVEGWALNGQCYFEVDAKPLPESVGKLLEENGPLLRAMGEQRGRVGEGSLEREREGASASSATAPDFPREASCAYDRGRRSFESFESELRLAFEEASWEGDTLRKIWSFGPRKCGPNILLNETDYEHRSFWESPCVKSTDVRATYESSMINGFQLATLAGPLCEEPMMGVCFVLKRWHISEDAHREDGPHSQYPSQAHVGGHLMSAFKEACRRAFTSRWPRLVTPMYSCSVLVNADVLACPKEVRRKADRGWGGKERAWCAYFSASMPRWWRLDGRRTYGLPASGACRRRRGGAKTDLLAFPPRLAESLAANETKAGCLVVAVAGASRGTIRESNERCDR